MYLLTLLLGLLLVLFKTLLLFLFLSLTIFVALKRNNLLFLYSNSRKALFSILLCLNLLNLREYLPHFILFSDFAFYLSFLIWLTTLLQWTSFYTLFLAQHGRPSNLSLPISLILTLLEALNHSLRAVSLGLRLYANLLSGFILTKVIFHCQNYLLWRFSLILVIGISFWMLELIIVLVQRNIFIHLATSYSKEFPSTSLPKITKNKQITLTERGICNLEEYDL